MICDNRWMLSVAQMSYMFGVFTGAVVLGSLADKYVVILNNYNYVNTYYDLSYI